jgi:Family of unknown function (DUF6011)
MEEVQCIKCGRPLRDADSIARGMGTECAGVHGGHRIRYRSGVRLDRSLSYAAIGHSSADTPILFTLVDDEQTEEPLVVEEVSIGRSGFAKILMQFPTDLVDLVLSAPVAGAIAWHVKNYSKKKKRAGSMPPGRILQEIRRMCIDLPLTFWPGISNQDQQIDCIPYGEEDRKFENSERVMRRQELESYLSRYGMIRSASRRYHKCYHMR